MVLSRRPAHAVLVPVLLAGCSQSLLDDGTGGDDGTSPGDPDAAPGTRMPPPVTGRDGGAAKPSERDRGTVTGAFMP